LGAGGTAPPDGGGGVAVAGVEGRVEGAVEVPMTFSYVSRNFGYRLARAFGSINMY